MDYPPSGVGKPGEWTAFAHGDGYRAYWLACGMLFSANISEGGGRIFVQLNGRTLTGALTLEEAMQLVEREVVRQVRDMLPAYRAIHARVEAAQARKDANVTILRPKKD